MNRLSYAAFLLSLAIGSPGLAKEKPITFTRDGISYQYTVTQISPKTKIIEGRASPGSPFRLVVSGDRVTGHANGVPVSFRVAQARAAAAPVAVATR